MKIFISSLITGVEPNRAAAKAAVESLGLDALMAEDFGAQPTTLKRIDRTEARRSPSPQRLPMPCTASKTHCRE